MKRCTARMHFWVKKLNQSPDFSRSLHVRFETVRDSTNNKDSRSWSKSTMFSSINRCGQKVLGRQLRVLILGHRCNSG